MQNSLQASILRFQIRKIFLETLVSLYSNSLQVVVAPDDVSSAFVVSAFTSAANQFGYTCMQIQNALDARLEEEFFYYINRASFSISSIVLSVASIRCFKIS